MTVAGEPRFRFPTSSRTSSYSYTARLQNYVDNLIYFTIPLASIIDYLLLPWRKREQDELISF